MKKQPAHALPVTAETLNAMHTAVGALAYAVALSLPESERRNFLSNMTRLAQARNNAGDLVGETAILDLCRAVALAIE